MGMCQNLILEKNKEKDETFDKIKVPEIFSFLDRRWGSKDFDC